MSKVEQAPAMQSMSGRRDCGHHETGYHGEEISPAYQVLTQHNLLETGFRLDTSAELDSVPPNATRGKNLALQICCFPCWRLKCFHTFEVSAGQVRLVKDGRGGFFFFGTGVHRICDPFYSVGKAESYQKGSICHGDLTLAVIEQGKIGYASEKGHPVMLPPGMHQWRSPTMVFENSFDLNNNVVRLGPYTLVTVDSGYAAVTEDNGLQKVLGGGGTYLLSHRNWKFQKYISQKIQSDNLKRIEATSADNVLMAVDATVIWRIVDVEKAALNAGETIARDGSETRNGDMGSIEKLKNDVLKQAEASLAAFIGAVNYSDTFNVAAAVQTGDGVSSSVEGRVVVGAPVAPADLPGAMPTRHDESRHAIASPLFDLTRMQTCQDHANAVTATYGVAILSINVVAAVPADKQLMVTLAQGAVAAAEAQKFEVVAAGKAAAAKIEARGMAEAGVLQARGRAEALAIDAKAKGEAMALEATGEAQAERTRAEGKKAAADLLESNETAVKLAMIDHTGTALGANKAFFFGTDVKDVGSLLATAAVADRVA